NSTDPAACRGRSGPCRHPRVHLGARRCLHRSRPLLGAVSLLLLPARAVLLPATLRGDPAPASLRRAAAGPAGAASASCACGLVLVLLLEREGLLPDGGILP